MRVFPAVEIRFTPEAETAFDLRDRLVAGLDDFQPTAIEESATLWRVFFDSRGSRDGALAWLRALGDARLTGEPLEVEDEDWARRSQAELGPVRAGRFVVTPPWCADAAREAARPDDLLIVVVPSTGFGTGHHASTRLCLELLQEVPVRGRTVLDIGTGSGVLAIAAARLGALSATAVDNDPDAIDAARENVALNGADRGVRLECADFRRLALPHAAIVIANLTGDLLRRAAPEVASRAAAGGHIILSGVLASEAAAVVAAFEAAGATLRARKTEDEWVGLQFTR
jgi:ribosomal protein L11 methyltransferase